MLCIEDDIKNAITVLHKADASIASQEKLSPHWQVIQVPEDVLTLRFGAAFVPLNLTEIAILGGYNDCGSVLGDVIIFDTTTCELKKEFEDETHFLTNGEN